MPSKARCLLDYLSSRLKNTFKFFLVNCVARPCKQNVLWRGKRMLNISRFLDIIVAFRSTSYTGADWSFDLDNFQTRKYWASFAHTMQVGLHAAVGNKLKDQAPAFLRANSYKLHEVAMMQPTEHLNFSNKLKSSLLIVTSQNFNSYKCVIIQYTLIHNSKSSFSYNIVRLKVVGCPLKLCQRETLCSTCVDWHARAKRDWGGGDNASWQDWTSSCKNRSSAC